MSCVASYSTTTTAANTNNRTLAVTTPSARYTIVSFTWITPNCRLRSSANSAQANAPESPDTDSSSAEKQVGKAKDAPTTSSNDRLLERLKRYGVSGILSYGLLNTAYYLTTFLVVWFFVTPSPGKMGYLEAVQRFLKVMAMVWAGSQVTKLIRAGGALALAPFVDKGLSWFTVKFGFESQGKAFMAIAGLCFGLAFFMFLAVTILSA